MRISGLHCDLCELSTRGLALPSTTYFIPLVCRALTEPLRCHSQSSLCTAKCLHVHHAQLSGVWEPLSSYTFMTTQSHSFSHSLSPSTRTCTLSPPTSFLPLSPSLSPSPRPPSRVATTTALRARTLLGLPFHKLKNYITQPLHHRML